MKQIAVIFSSPSHFLLCFDPSLLFHCLKETISFAAAAAASASGTLDRLEYNLTLNQRLRMLYNGVDIAQGIRLRWF